MHIQDMQPIQQVVVSKELRNQRVKKQYAYVLDDEEVAEDDLLGDEAHEEEVLEEVVVEADLLGEEEVAEEADLLPVQDEVLLMQSIV